MTIVDDERKKRDDIFRNDGMLEHKGMAWQSMLLTYLIDKRRRNIFPATTIAEYRSYLILKRPTTHQFHPSYLFLKKAACTFFFLLLLRVS